MTYNQLCMLLYNLMQVWELVATECVFESFIISTLRTLWNYIDNYAY